MHASHGSLRIGSRTSLMARTMAEAVRQHILAAAPSADPVVLAFASEGDKIKGSLQRHGGKGTFVKDLERRLLAGEIDCAVHSLKDIPGDLTPHPDLTLTSFFRRENPCDALVLRAGVTEEDLKRGGRIGSSSPRRKAALQRLYPNATVDLCRGNADGRVGKLDAGDFDALILAASGLERVGLEQRIARIYTPEDMLPAIGQGIVVLQARRADVARCPYLQQLSDAHAESAARVERAMLFRLQGNCHSAIAGYCDFLRTGDLRMRGIVYHPETGAPLEAERSAPPSSCLEDLGIQVAEDLFAQGARGLIGLDP